MTAEEKLKERTEALKHYRGTTVNRDVQGFVRLSSEDIDLIANLVVERLKNEV